MRLHLKLGCLTILYSFKNLTIRFKFLSNKYSFMISLFRRWQVE